MLGNLKRWNVSLVVALCVGLCAIRSGVTAAQGNEPDQVVEAFHKLPGTDFSKYFAEKERELRCGPSRQITSGQELLEQQPKLRLQFRDMLGLNPWPERGELQPVVTHQFTTDEIVVENLHFQSSPGLYVTGNLYRPQKITKPLPTVLYLCGHARVKDPVSGQSYGNKTGYHHHGVWFARHGFVCLMLDTIQLGEIEGEHHGTFRFDRWWWNSRGYTPAGVEAWNAIRAIDFLATRPDVDIQRLGVTGRSGGGASTWWVTALDDRVKVAVPVAGITTLKNHVVDGCVDGHCDCMYFVNLYGWDYHTLAALCAPRPLLIVNTDRDSIFPLDGVLEVHREAQRLYGLLNQSAQCAVAIGYGPHKDLQELQLAAFRWFRQHLQSETAIADVPGTATKVFEPKQLRVFSRLPIEERVTNTDEWFVPVVSPNSIPRDRGFTEWAEQAVLSLRACAFQGWPKKLDANSVIPRKVFEQVEGALHWELWVLPTEPHIVTTVLLVRHQNSAVAERMPQLSQLHVNMTTRPEQNPGDSWKERIQRLRQEQLAAEPTVGHAIVIPRIIDVPSGQTPEVALGILRKNRRRHMLLGQTLAGMQVYDLSAALEFLGLLTERIALTGLNDDATIALYAALFQAKPLTITLQNMAASHRDAPDFLGVQRIWDIPQAIAAASLRHTVRVHKKNPEDPAWRWELAK